MSSINGNSRNKCSNFDRIVRSWDASRRPEPSAEGEPELDDGEPEPLSDLVDATILDDEFDGSGIFDVFMADNLDNKNFSSEGWCRKGPNEEFSNEETNREWVIDLARIRQEWPAA